MVNPETHNGITKDRHYCPICGEGLDEFTTALDDGYTELDSVCPNGCYAFHSDPVGYKFTIMGKVWSGEHVETHGQWLKGSRQRNNWIERCQKERKMSLSHQRAREDGFEVAWSLAQALKEAGGNLPKLEDIMKMTLGDFMSNVAAQNNIRFVYKPKSNRLLKTPTRPASSDAEEDEVEED